MEFVKAANWTTVKSICTTAQFVGIANKNVLYTYKLKRNKSGDRTEEGHKTAFLCCSFPADTE